MRRHLALLLLVALPLAGAGWAGAQATGAFAVSPSPSPTATAAEDCPDPSPSPSASLSPSPSASESPSPAGSPSPSVSLSPSPTEAPTATGSPSGTASPSEGASPTASPTPSSGETASPAPAESGSVAPAALTPTAVPRRGSVAPVMWEREGATPTPRTSPSPTSSSDIECLPAEEEVVVLSECTWFVSGLAPQVSLAPRADGVSYSGEPLVMRSERFTLSAQVRASGGGIGEPCTWRSSSPSPRGGQGLMIAVSASGLEFGARAQVGDSATPDPAMSFPLTGGTRSLVIAVDQSASCSPGFGSPGSLDISEQATGGSLLSIPAVHVRPTSSCTVTLTYRTEIPGGLLPRYPGVRYEFLGPTLTYTVQDA